MRSTQTSAVFLRVGIRGSWQFSFLDCAVGRPAHHSLESRTAVLLTAMDYWRCVRNLSRGQRLFLTCVLDLPLKQSVCAEMRINRLPDARIRRRSMDQRLRRV